MTIGNGKRWRLLGAAMALAFASSAAESPAERGKRIVQEAVQALGGDAFLHMTDRVETGRAYSFYRSEITALSLARFYTRYTDNPAPGKLALRERESFLTPGKTEETSAVLLTENGAWDITYRGAEPLDDAQYRGFVDSTEHGVLYILRCRLNEPGLDFYWDSTDVQDNRPVEIVEITDAAGEKITVSFDQDTKLPLRQVWRHRNLQFKDFDTETSLYSNYHDAGHGVRLPTIVQRDRNGEKLSAMYADSVEVDRNPSADLFVLPANVKILTKKK
ncbi:MAG TPA: hypothetical protein VMU19_10765 [Bryobacteraceae bacterium]|nr:hypothetical protein [Bryobacteraceae bacterium]